MSGSPEFSNRKARPSTRWADGVIEPESVGVASSNRLPSHVVKILQTPGRPLDGAQERRIAAQVPVRVGAVPAATGGLVSEPLDASEVEADRITASGGAHGARAAPAWDFSRVRVHTGPDARSSAQALRATAYAVGEDIVVGGSGDYPPRSPGGERMLLHELVHVAQHQRGPSHAPVISRQSDDAHRQHATAAPSPAAAPAGASPPAASDPAVERLRARVHQGALEALRNGPGLRLPLTHVPSVPILHLAPMTVRLPGPPRPTFTLPPEPLRLPAQVAQPPAPVAPTGPTPPATTPAPPDLQPPAPMFSSWTNSAQVLPYGHINEEHNFVYQGGSGGPSLTSQSSVRLGLGRGYELGAVGNVGLPGTGPLTGAGGPTLHYGAQQLDTERWRGGFIGMGTVGSGPGTSGTPALVVNLTFIPLLSRRVPGPLRTDDDQRQLDINPGVPSYSSAGSFGPGLMPAPHLLTLPGQAQYTIPIDSHNSVSAEVLGGPGVALGTLGSRAPLYGLRGGTGFGYSNTSGSGSSLGTFGLNVNAYTDITSAGFSYTMFATVTWAFGQLTPLAPTPVEAPP